ncbi:MAG TPA: HAD-IB family hydrolase [Puia sp.]|nr:HAD-IB family hydrolase [Puia sp.]
MNQRIAFFDFDGTITTKDTLLEFIKFSRGSLLFYLGFLLTSPWVLAYKVKLISNQQAKEKVLQFFFSNWSLSRFQESCDQFGKAVLPGLIRPKALQEIEKLRERGFAVVIVSASPENWIRTWAEQVQATLIATRLAATEEQVLTGRILGANCHGQEKVNRIRQEYDLADFREIYAYGDTSGDRPMLQLGTASFFKPFR